MLDARERGVEPVARDGLDEEVERLDLERLDGRVGVPGEEHDLRRIVEAAQQPRELDALDLRHPHVEQQHVEAALAQAQQRLAAAAGGLDARHARRGLEQALDVRQRSWLVVDGQHDQTAHSGTSVRGMRHDVRRLRRRSPSARARRRRAAAPRCTGRPPRAAAGRAPSATGPWIVPGPRGRRPRPASGSCDGDAVREARLLQAQEGRGVRELLRGADRAAVLAQAVGEELPELGEHVARVVGVLVDVARGGREHVVDEVRGDGRPLAAPFGGGCSRTSTITHLRANASVRTGVFARRSPLGALACAARRAAGLQAGAQLL